MIWRNFSLTFATKCAVFLGSLAQGVFVTRLLGPEGKGLLSWYQANVAFSVLLLGLTLPTAINYFAAKGQISSRRLLGFSLQLLGLAIALLVAVGMISRFFADHHLLLRKGDSVFYVFYFFASFFLTFLGGIYYSLFAGLSRFKLINLVEALIVGLRILVFATLYFYSWASVEQIFALDLFFQFLTLFFWIVAGWKLERLVPEWVSVRSPDSIQIFQYILPLYGSTLVSFLYTRIDLWIVEDLRGLEALGIYSIAIGAAQLITFFPIAINTVLYTSVTQASQQDRPKLFSRFSQINFFFVFLAAVLLASLSDYLVTTLYGNTFADAAGPLKVLVWAAAFSSIKYLFILYNQINVKLKENILVELLVLVLSLVLHFLLIPRWGILGASMSVSIANFLALVFLIARLETQVHMTIWNLFLPSWQDFCQFLKFFRK